VHEKNVEELAEKMMTLILNPKNWEIMGMAGRKKVENYFNINTLNDQLLKILIKIIN
jgi:colanic acid/amylovoran biosynthesis glycosyltransferase